MRLLFSGLIFSLSISLGVGALSAQAQQISDTQVQALVEALRQAAPQTETENDGLYSDWQILPANIPRWSRSCIGRELSPTQFEASPATARTVVTCVMQDVLQDEYRASGGSETLAIRRAAAWWMTGDPTRYNSNGTATYTQRVLSFYQQQRRSTPATSPQTQASPARPTAATPAQQSSDYDRYMQAGYTSTQQSNYPTALLYFNRALDERPNNTYAEQAIRNVEGYQRSRGGNATSTAGSPEVSPDSPQAASPGTPNTTGEWTEVAVNDVGDRFLVNRNSIQMRENSVWYWEYRRFQQPNNAFVGDEIEQPVHAVMLYRSVDCAAGVERLRQQIVYNQNREVIRRFNYGDTGRLTQAMPGSSAIAVLQFVCSNRNSSQDES